MRPFIVASSGVDEYRQGLSSDPYQANLASAYGLRIPQFVNTNTTRFLFLLATAQVTKPGIRLRRVKTLSTLGCVFGNVTTGPFSVVEYFPITPSFCFPDGNISYHLVLEPNVKQLGQRPLTDAANFVMQDADGPALLYGAPCSWAAGSFNTTTGAPLYYASNMTSYTPPSKTKEWEPVAGLGCFYDTRIQDMDLWIPTTTTCRLSLYASVLQTDPQNRPDPSVVVGIANMPPDWQPIEQFPFKQSGEVTVQTGFYYHRVHGELMLDYDRRDPPQEKEGEPCDSGVEGGLRS